MRQLVTLPRLLAFRLTGFQPIFRRDIAMSLNSGPCIILGGNGLGKTTIMQAVVFGLTGGVGEAIEEDKRLRWDHRYFRGRLDAAQLRSATIEVDFAFGNVEVTVRRGLTGSHLTGFRSAGSKQWIEDIEESRLAFEQALRDFGGFQSTDDFAFIVHRLLYLPETRRLLAWDTNAQLRIFMMLNQDASREAWFNERRNTLVKLDSKKRHIHVALGKAKASLTSLMEFDEAVTVDEEPAVLETEIPTLGFNRLVDELRRASKETFNAEALEHDARRNLSDVSIQIESLHRKIETVEAALIDSLLSKQERDSSLALHKLLENAVCPACGTIDPELRAIAEKNARAQCCLLCGANVPQGTNHELTTLRSQLSEKLKAQRVIEDSLSLAEAKLSIAQQIEDELQRSATLIQLQQPLLTPIESMLPVPVKDQLLVQQSELRSQEANLEKQMYTLQRQLRREFQRFRAEVAVRTAQLGKLYTRYATSFLGLKCELIETEESDRLLTLTRFVPKFNNSPRENPETCSEAQRFFLDIAFRMALIDLSSNFSRQPGTFICETPETTLDMSYVDNVVKMFGEFCQNKHALLLSANIQRNGIAGKLLSFIPKRKRRNHVLNLLDIGQLSAVHVAALPRLRAAVRQTLQ